MEDRSSYISIAFASILGIVLSQMAIGGLILTVPALLLAARLKDTKTALIPFGIMLFGILLWDYLDFRSILTGPEGIGLLALSMFLPVSSVIGGVSWVYSREKSGSIMRRLFIASVPVIVLGTGLSLWFTTDAAQGVKVAIANVFSSMYFTQNLAFDTETMAQMVMVVLMMGFSFLGMVASGFPIMVSELSVHRNDQDWQAEFAWMKFPDNYVWFFIGAWALALLSSFITAIPIWLMSISWNLALSFTILYGVQGTSILVSLMRRKNPVILANRVVVLVIILLLLPGVNVVAAIGLPVLGALETWIRFRQ